MRSETGQISWSPVIILGEERVSRWLIICDHATNRVPASINGGELGIADADMARHIAYDPGAAGVSIRLGELLGAPVVLSNFSRLVIDPNRGEDDPTLVMQLYDGTIIPANRNIDGAEVARRIDLCFRPYHHAVAQMAGRQSDTVIVSVHSFTPQLRNRPARPWHIGLLYADDARLSDPLIRALRHEPGLVVGANEPYTGWLAGDTIDRHAIANGRQNTLIEIRNDLIQHDEGQVAWADRLARLLPPALTLAET
ncbi:MAG: N-formylglutamate amidohydrolase [Boseongicola sp.]|nr:N-formylglutamate amidohydrolase [Silicimonas sp.]NNF91606.1 N-formylglutamate amidohydrolase [Boseongicola sp.]